MSDISNISTAYYVRKNPVEALIGTEDNSFINRWGGEIERYNFTIKMLNQRGNNNGVLVEYKKNLTGFEADILWDGLITKIMPVGKDGLLLPEKYIDSPLITYYPLVKVASVEFSDCETVEDLRAVASTYFQDTLCDVPRVNYSVDMVELSSTEEYKNYQIFERVDVGDTVTVRHKDFNINITARAISVIKTATWVNGELTWVTSNIELGNFKENSATQTMNTINQLAKVIETNKSDLAVAIERATDLITGTFGGNLVINRTPNGQPYELLIMDTDDINTAKDVWRFNQGGLGHSSNGYNGPYETAITQDGQIVANFITTGNLNADLIKAGSIKSKNGRISLNLEDDTFTLYDAGGNKSIEFDDTSQRFYDWDDDHRVGTIFSSRREGDPNKKGLVLSCELGNYVGINYRNTEGEFHPFIEFDNGALGNQTPIRLRSQVAFDRKILGYVALDGHLSVVSERVAGDLICDGDLSVIGDKQCVQETKTYGKIPFYSTEDVNSILTETPIEEIHETTYYKETEKYKCIISLSNFIRECINTELPYNVWLSKLGPGDLWIANIYPGYFVVESDRPVKFKYKLEGRRKGFEDRTLENNLNK